MQTASGNAERLAAEVQSGLKNPVRLHRETALKHLQQYLHDAAAIEQDAFRLAMCALVLELLPSDTWQHRLGGFDAAQVLMPTLPPEATFHASILSACQRHLEDEEPRVRASVAAGLRQLASQQGTVIFDTMGPQIIQSIQSAFDRDPPPAPEEGRRGSGDYLGQLLQTSYRQQLPGEGELRHDTEGWRALESSFKALQALMEGCGSAALPYLTPEVQDLILRSLLHQSRFVRERGYRVVEAMVGVCGEAELRTLAPTVAARLADGLNDSWSHVQYAASEATRSFLMATAAFQEFQEELLPALLPAMCFNRHSVAEGLRNYSQQTWQQVMGDGGRACVAKCIAQVVAYYVRAARLNSGEFREAACECMSELAAKIERSAVLPHVPTILASLVSCFRDSAWPVREAACEACGQVALAYPDEARELLPKLYPLWLDHVAENVPSVRETAAAALGNAVRAFGNDAARTIVPQAETMLQKVKDQPADDDKYVKTSYGVAAVRVDEPQRSEDDALFGGPAVEPVGFSGGGKSSRLFSTSAMTKEPADCCMDQGFERERQPWEAADGAVYLVRELAAVAPDSMATLMPLLADAVRADHYAHACHLQETAWRQLPQIARHLGKRVFKRYLEPFLEPLFRSIQLAMHQGCQSAAIAAAGFLRDWLGPRIFAGRLSAEQQQIMTQFVPSGTDYGGTGLSAVPSKLDLPDAATAPMVAR